MILFILLMALTNSKYCKTNKDCDDKICVFYSRNKSNRDFLIVYYQNSYHDYRIHREFEHSLLLKSSLSSILIFDFNIGYFFFFFLVS